MIRAIIFDCFGVLYQGSLEHLRDLTPPEKRDELSDISRSSDYGYISYEEYMERVAQLTDKPKAEIERIVQADHIRNEAMVKLVQEVHADYRVGLLSNVGRDLITRLFTPDELESMFDAVVLSSEVGMTKPYPEIYQLMAERLDVAPNDCVMIDDMPGNIEGARLTGMDGLVFTTTNDTATRLHELLHPSATS